MYKGVSYKVYFFDKVAFSLYILFSINRFSRFLFAVLLVLVLVIAEEGNRRS